MLAFLHYLQSIHPLNPELQAALLACVRYKSLRKGQVWLQEGAVCDKLAFIEKGVVKIYFESGPKEVALWFVRENELAICAQSFFEQRPASFAIRAVEPTQLYYLMHSDLQRVLQLHPALNLHLRLILQHYLARSESHTELLLCSARERFERIQQLHPWMADKSRLTDKMLAAYLGITPAAVCVYRRG
jgi:CRP-like cAMP-binding protein